MPNCAEVIGVSFVDEYEKSKAKLEVAIDEVLESSVKDGLLKALQDSVENRVYGAYTPTMYVRREYDGGLIADENFMFIPGDMELNVANIATGNKNYADANGAQWDSGDISDLIEAGIGYHWIWSDIYKDMPYPRPFMHEGLSDYVGSGDAESDLVTGLNARGFTNG